MNLSWKSLRPESIPIPAVSVASAPAIAFGLALPPDLGDDRGWSRTKRIRFTALGCHFYELDCCETRSWPDGRSYSAHLIAFDRIPVVFQWGSYEEQSTNHTGFLAKKYDGSNWIPFAFDSNEWDYCASTNNFFHDFLRYQLKIGQIRKIFHMKKIFSITR